MEWRRGCGGCARRLFCRPTFRPSDRDGLPNSRARICPFSQLEHPGRPRRRGAIRTLLHRNLSRGLPHTPERAAESPLTGPLPGIGFTTTSPHSLKAIIAPSKRDAAIFSSTPMATSHCTGIVSATASPIPIGSTHRPCHQIPRPSSFCPIPYPVHIRGILSCTACTPDDLRTCFAPQAGFFLRLSRPDGGGPLQPRWIFPTPVS